MKRQVMGRSIMVAALVFVSGDVFAVQGKVQKNSLRNNKKAAITKNIKVVSNKKIQKIAQASGASTQAQVVPAPVKESRSPRPSEATVSVPITKVTTEVTPKKWGLKYRSFNSMDTRAAQGAGGSDQEIRAWDRLALSYKLTPDFSVILEPNFFHTWFGDRDRNQDSSVQGLEQGFAAYMGNTSLIANHSKLATLPGEVILDSYLRYDLPTSEWSQKAGEVGQIWAEVGLTKTFGKVEVKVSETVRYYLQTYNSSSLDQNEKPDERGFVPAVANKQYRLYHLLDVSVPLSSKLAMNFETGFSNERYYPDSAQNRDEVFKDRVIMNVELAYSFNDNFALALGIWEEPDMRAYSKTDDVYVPFDSKNGGSETYLMATAKF